MGQTVGLALVLLDTKYGAACLRDDPSIASTTSRMQGELSTTGKSLSKEINMAIAALVINSASARQLRNTETKINCTNKSLQSTKTC